MDSTIPEHGNDKNALQIDALVAWVKAQPNRAEAQRRLEEASGIAINYKAFGRVVTDGRWDRKGHIRRAWLTHSDSPVCAPDSEADSEAAVPAAEEVTETDTQRDTDGGKGQSTAAESDESRQKEPTGGNDEELLPRGIPLEDMVAAIDARADAESEQEEDQSPHSGQFENIEWSRQQVAQATTVEEIAAYAGAPVLKEVRGLSLENARVAALMKLDGWAPTDRDRRPPGLHGDGPILLYLGEEVSYVDEGARQLAFAHANKWQGESPYCAQQMRYGVSPDVRQRRYVVESHHERPNLIGHRKADWAPETSYVDSDQFFGSTGFQREDGTWMPSRAEALAYLYQLRGIESAFRGTAADGKGSPYFLIVQKTRMELEFMLLGDEYQMSFHYHGAGRRIPDSTRIAERRSLESQILDLERQIAAARRRLAVIRTLRSVFTSPFTGARRVVRRLKRRRRHVLDPVAPEYAGRDPETGHILQVSRPIYETVLATDAEAAAYAASLERGDGVAAQAVEEDFVTGEREWQAADPSWDRRDRTQWYEPGTGPLSPEAAGHADMLPVPDRPFVPAEPEESLLRIRPPRVGEFSLSSFESVLDSLGEDHTLSVEIVGGGGETQLLVRTVYPDRVVNFMELHYPGVQFERVTPEEDPLRLHEGKVGWRRILRPQGPEFLPFSVYDEQKAPPTADPFLDVIGAQGQDLHEGERLVSRVVLRQKPHGWSEKWRARALSGPGSENAQAVEQQRREAQTSNPQFQSDQASNPGLFGDFKSLVLWVLVGVTAIAGIGAWIKSMIDSGLLRVLIAYAVAAVAAAGFSGFAAWKMGAIDALRRLWNPEPPVPHDPAKVELRIAGGAYEFEVQTIAILGERSDRSRAARLLDTVVNTYRSFDDPLGARFDVEELNLLVTPKEYAKLTRRQRKGVDSLGDKALEFGADSRRYGVMSRRPVNGIVGTKEAAAFWHLPGGSVELPAVRRIQSRRLRPPVSAIRGGALVGVAHDADGGQRLVYRPAEVSDKHTFLVARTRMGKSTVMVHIGGGLMAAKARGESEDALVVIDPHSDLVRDLLRCVPEEIVDRVVLVDLGDRERTVGLNLLDTRVFKDRDTAVQAIIEVAKGTWQNWGGRMESILSHVLMALYEANETLPRRRQLTMLDGSLMLSDETFRDAVLDRVTDATVVDWWRAAHGGWAREYGQDAVAPVVTRLSGFAGSKVVRAILGQRRCTVDLGDIISRGDVLLVNSSQSVVGPEVSALVGVSILKLVEAIVTEQGGVSESETRRRVSVIVDEMHTLEGVDFQKILSQIGKRGGILTMATQSLASLDIVGDTMREDILANTGVIMTFQVNAVDAARLLPELRSEYLDEADITGLPVHHAYVRLIGDGEVEPPFTMEVLPPLVGDERIRRIIEQGSRRYTRPRTEVLEELNRAMEERVKHFRAQIRERRETRSRDETIDLSQYGGGERTRGRRNRRSDGKDAE